MIFLLSLLSFQIAKQRHNYLLEAKKCSEGRTLHNLGEAH